MNQESGPHGAGGFLGRLIENSRRLFGHKKADQEQELKTLSRLIEQGIIPRLHMRFSTAQHRSDERDATTETPEYDVYGFVGALLSRTSGDAADFVDRLRLTEHSLIEVYQHLLAPAARRLGEMWDNDECGFAEVTIAIAKIRHLFIATAPLFPVHESADKKDRRSILMTTTPGEQHTFGVYLAVEHFRAHEWTVWSGTPRNTRELIELASKEPYDVIGLSIGSERSLEAAKTAIRELRENAVNSDVVLLAGGSLLFNQPELADDLAADLLVHEIDDSLISQTAELVAKRRLARP
ncbi:MAG: cobalamin B12-binding domain-containing protein [Pseudomonadota bacterium]